MTCRLQQSVRVEQKLVDPLIHQLSRKEKEIIDVNISLRPICQQIVRNNQKVDNHHYWELLSPLISIDDIVIGILIQMSSI